MEYFFRKKTLLVWEKVVFLQPQSSKKRMVENESRLKQLTAADVTQLVE